MNLFESLSAMLLMDEKELRSFALTAPYRYKVYTIAKRNSDDRRIIAHPSKELKFIQRLIINMLLPKLPVHSAATAYIKGKSIKDNAIPHASKKYLLKMDLKDFFPSIKPDLFFKECRHHKIEISETDKSLLEGFLFWKTRRSNQLKLSIGAPSSPFISNFILYRFDEEVSKLCRAEGVTYTRYADDLTFSTNKKDVLLSYQSKVRRIIGTLYNGNIKVNLKKTVLSSKGHNRHVTGITLSNDGSISLGREQKRKISAGIHHFSLNLLEHEDVLKLGGKLAHASFIEPSFLEKMIKKYGQEAISRLMKTT
ncbi:retron St85 family RNA-directed DNA polymerase [Vibrio campbellii]|uniref:retron St85 family RNA-directed DNA polymerase n=1 Tax=Vibrio campbellii TaxID=680 RepID=UPI001F47D0F9|nr:retron St85 family RNA-directed DNA polymerase [Vibrio campbellii]MCE7727984.1 retron St85 family RNA-directed DNA polymerase [Vibrio campbellii]